MAVKLVHGEIRQEVGFGFFIWLKVGWWMFRGYSNMLIVRHNYDVKTYHDESQAMIFEVY